MAAGATRSRCCRGRGAGSSTGHALGPYGPTGQAPSAFTPRSRGGSSAQTACRRRAISPRDSRTRVSLGRTARPSMHRAQQAIGQGTDTPLSSIPAGPGTALGASDVLLPVRYPREGGSTSTRGRSCSVPGAARCGGLVLHATDRDPRLLGSAWTSTVTTGPDRAHRSSATLPGKFPTPYSSIEEGPCVGSG
jgi:hypothetical protein